MTYWPEEAFFTLHRDLPREGPGEPEDVHWAAEVAQLRPGAQMADVACGPGPDIAALLEAAPEGHVTALDKVAHFVDAARARYAADDRVTVLKADMARIHNEYDLIWCAGAVYFLGVTEALKAWRKSLRPGGVVAFSEPCWFTDAPSAAARACWESEGYSPEDADGIARKIAAAGYEVLGTRRLSDAAWEAYYRPMEARIAALEPDADDGLREVLEDARREIAAWRAHRDEFGYLLSVARPA